MSEPVQPFPLFDHPCCHAMVECVKLYYNSDAGKVLDIGCGNGRDLYFLATNRLLTTGVGVDDHHTPDIYSDFPLRLMNLVFVKDEALSFVSKLQSDSFTFVMMNNSFEHFEKPLEVLKEVLRVLEEGFCVFITLPYDHNHNDADHKQWFVETSLSAILQEAGFEVVECRPIGGGNLFAVGRKPLSQPV